MPRMLHVPDENIISSKALSDEAANMPLILQGPDENILSISSFLSIQDIRCLASTCRSLRATLIASHGATTCIWARRIQEAFPEVFRHVNGITFAIAPLPGTINEINLPLLTHLLPQRYPHSIDPSTLKSDITTRPLSPYKGTIHHPPWYCLLHKNTMPKRKTKGKTDFFGSMMKSLVVVYTLLMWVSVLTSLTKQETAIQLNDKVSILENPSVCELVNNMQSTNHTPRYAVTLHEEVSSSKTFSIIPFPLPEEISVHYPPKTSVRAIVLIWRSASFVAAVAAARPFGGTRLT
jgi:hypothetical protein